MSLKVTAGRALAAVALAAAGGACGSSSSNPTSAFHQTSPSSIQVTQAPVVNDVALASGSDTHQVAATIQAFYRATWENRGSAACSLFSPTGASGFMSAAKVAFPQSVNSTTTCPQVMAFFNADLADSADTLQQSGVNISGNVLDNVGVDHIKISGDTATAQAPEGVEEFIKPKTFLMIHRNGRWLIAGSHKIGQTLAQMLAAAKAQGKLRPTSSTSNSAG